MQSSDKIHIYSGVETDAEGLKTVWRWRMVARNGRTVLSSGEPFSSKQKAEGNIERGLRGFMVKTQGKPFFDAYDNAGTAIRVPVEYGHDFG